MKKLISLIASLSLAATMVAPVFAAEIANNAPVVETTIQELTAAEFENDWVGEPLEDGYKAYLVDVNFTGLDLANACAGTTNVLKKKRTGVLLADASYKINFDSTENIGGVYSMDGIASGSSTEKTVYAIFAPGTAVANCYPTIADGGAATTATEAFVYQYVITTKGEVTGTVTGTAKVVKYESDSSKDNQSYDDSRANISYKVDGVAGAAIKFGASAPVDPITVGTRHDLAAGKAWDVTINEFDAAKTYTATFTDTDTTETKVNDFDLSIFAESDGAKVAFVTLLKTTRANITLDVE